MQNEDSDDNVSLNEGKKSRILTHEERLRFAEVFTTHEAIDHELRPPLLTLLTTLGRSESVIRKEYKAFTSDRNGYAQPRPPKNHQRLVDQASALIPPFLYARHLYRSSNIEPARTYKLKDFHRDANISKHDFKPHALLESYFAK
jgi:hypothetical protein